MIIISDNTRLEMAKLKNLWLSDGSQLNIVNEGCSKWHDVGLLIDMPSGILSGVQEKHNIVLRFTEVLNHWIQNGGNGLDFKMSLWILS